MKRRILALALALGMLICLPVSADVPISGLPASTTPAAADLIPMVHSGVTSKTTVAQLFGNASAIISNVSVGSAVFAMTNNSGGSNQTIFGSYSAISVSGVPCSTLLISAIGIANMFCIDSTGDVGVETAIKVGGSITAGGAYTQTSGDIGAARSGTSAGYWFGSNSSTAGFIYYDSANYYFDNPGASATKATISASTGAYTALSDRREKHDIKPITDGLATVMKLKPSSFAWNVNGKYDDGFIAQDVRDVLPEAVSFVDPKHDRLGISYNPIVAKMANAIQEQQAEIVELRHEVAAKPGHSSFFDRLHWLFSGS